MGEAPNPTFLILGAPKCGTTSLYYYLDQHPDVCMSKPKETRFFDRFYDQGVEAFCRNHFGHWQGEQVVGEATATNVVVPYVPERIRRDLPRAKLIVMVRNPIERAFSNWWMHRQLGCTSLAFVEAIEKNHAQLIEGHSIIGESGGRMWLDFYPSFHKDRGGPWLGKRHWPYLEIGYYALHLKRYLNYFDPGQVKVVLLDDLRDAPQDTLREILAFIGVDPGVEIKAGVAHNAALSAGARASLRVLRALKVNRLMSRRTKSWLKGRFMAKWGRKPVMSASIRDWLIEHYRPHNRDLESLLQRDLSHWDR